MKTIDYAKKTDLYGRFFSFPKALCKAKIYEFKPRSLCSLGIMDATNREPILIWNK